MGRQFDPDVVDALIRVLTGRRPEDVAAGGSTPDLFA